MMKNDAGSDDNDEFYEDKLTLTAMGSILIIAINLHRRSSSKKNSYIVTKIKMNCHP